MEADRKVRADSEAVVRHANDAKIRKITATAAFNVSG
jgi:hypothetical protein